MPRLRLTQTNCDAVAIPHQGSVVYQDTKLRGLTLRVLYTGSKQWVVQYRLESGKRRRITIGKYPDLNVDDAAKKAAGVLGEAARGNDPHMAQRIDNADMTYGDWSFLYCEEVKAHKKSWRDDVMGYQPLARKYFGEIKLKKIERSMIAKTHIMLAEVNESGKATKPAKANRWLASVSACLAAAVRGEYLEYNPALHIKKFPENPPRSRVLNEEESAALLAALEEENVDNQIAFRLLLATGARSSEVINAKWGDLLLEERLWRMSDTKAGKPQVVPLRGDLAALLKMIRATMIPAPKSTDYLVPGPQGGKRFSLTSVWRRLKKNAKLPADLRIHDIRRTVGLKVAMSSGLHVASKLLRHSDISVTEKVYAPLSINELRGAVEGLGDVGADQDSK